MLASPVVPYLIFVIFTTYPEMIFVTSNIFVCHLFHIFLVIFCWIWAQAMHQNKTPQHRQRCLHFQGLLQSKQQMQLILQLMQMTHLVHAPAQCIAMNYNELHHWCSFLFPGASASPPGADLFNGKHLSHHRHRHRALHHRLPSLLQGKDSFCFSAACSEHFVSELLLFAIDNTVNNFV